MASPQLEHGYARVANEILEALARTPLNGSQLRIILIIVRECYGRNGGRKVAPLSLAKIADWTGLDYRNVQREVNKLLKAGVLTKQSNGGRNLYGTQKDYERWQLPSSRKHVEPVEGDGELADGQLTNGQVTRGGTVNSPSKGTVNSPTHKKKEESLKNISSKPSGSDRSVPSSGNGKGKIKATILCLWNYYIAKLGKNPKLLTLTALREQKARSRLEECLRKTGGDLGKAEQLMQMAIDAVAASDFHRGANESKKHYDSWERNLFPSQEKLEWWLERAGG